MICLPVGPRCDSCDLSKAGLCPSAKRGGSPKKRKAVFKGSPDSEIEIALDVQGDHPVPTPSTPEAKQG